MSIRSKYIYKPPLGVTIDWSNPLTRQLVGCWLMQPGGGFVRNLADTRLCPFTNQKYNNGDVSFDGSSNYIDVPQTSRLSLSSQTLMALVYPNTMTQAWRGIIEHNRLGNNWYGLFTSGAAANKFHYRWSGSTSDFTTTTLAGAWYQITGTLDGLYPNTYLNGKVDWNGGSSTAPTPTDSTTRFGANQSGGEFFNGYCKYIYIWSRALPLKSINSLYLDPYQFITSVRTIKKYLFVKPAPATAGGGILTPRTSYWGDL